ncbi:MAG: hypothetical protein ACLFOZ_14250, partial [Cyclobacteriaceae bacterium]
HARYADLKHTYQYFLTKPLKTTPGRHRTGNSNLYPSISLPVEKHRLIIQHTNVYAAYFIAKSKDATCHPCISVGKNENAS